MQFGILGPTRAWHDDGQELAIGGARLRALLARLLIDPGRVVSAERLIDDLYGDQPPAGAANALQSQVSRLRRLLPAGLVEFHPAGYQLAVDPETVDAHRFAQLAAAGHRALAGGDPPRAGQLLREALRQWRGPALADVADAPFAAGQVARLEELRLAATEDRIEAVLALGEPGPLVAELRELVAAHPLRERPRGQLMRALYGGGRQAEALAVFEDLRQRLADQLGADPSPELAAVHVAVLRGDDWLARAPAAARHGLPAQLTSFVGREEELRRVGKLLGEGRLVTLTGPGGAGKTRLAIEVAGRQPGEPCLVELAPLVDGTDVPQGVLSALGLRDAALRQPTAGGLDPTDRLVAALGPRPLVLLLDNCEHVIDAAARLADRLLSACPHLRILATSREPLGLTGEALCPVSGLPLPPPEAPAGTAQEYASVRLFLDRAADITSEPMELAAVRTICRTLDGLPLAIELAAARLRSLPVTEIAGRLDDRFRLLSRGSRTAQPRHQTLRAVVEWSWDLLDGPEQTLARRLTVFAGGATLDAVEHIGGLPPEEIVEVLTSLTEKSLVEASGGRYRMLETIRAFGAERLAEVGEAERLRQSHAGYFLELAQTAAPYLRRAEQLEWLSRLDFDRDNLHTALRRAAGSGDHESALRLVAALAFYWWLRGLRGEGAALASEVLAAVGPRPPAGLAEEHALCVLIAALTNAPAGSGDPADNELLATAAASVYHTEDPPRQPFLYFLSAMATGPPEGGTAGIAKTIEQAQHRIGDDPWLRALVPVGFGIVAAMAERPTEAEELFDDALERFRALGERWGMSMALANFAEAANGRGEFTRAAAAVDEALRLADELDSAMDVADLLRIRGEGLVRAGDLAGAHAAYERAERLARPTGATEQLATARLGLGEVARRRGDLAAARRLAETALAECPTGWFSAEEVRAAAFVMLGRIAEAEGETGTARAWYHRALATTVAIRSLSAAGADARAALARLEPSADGA